MSISVDVDSDIVDVSSESIPAKPSIDVEQMRASVYEALEGLGVACTWNCYRFEAEMTAHPDKLMERGKESFCAKCQIKKSFLDLKTAFFPNSPHIDSIPHE
jgi:hypothetical protein